MRPDRAADPEVERLLAPGSGLSLGRTRPEPKAKSLKPRSARAFAPASLGNVALGFDTLGAALRPLEGPPLGDVVEIAPLPSSLKPQACPRRGYDKSLTCTGPFAHELPSDPQDNLAFAAVEAFERALGRELPPLALKLEKGLPVGSGLGSSSATVVAVLKALDALFGPLPEGRLLQAAGEAEARASGSVHLDNVAPALLGGLRLVTPEGRAEALPWPQDLRFVVLSPEFRLDTRTARRVLPESVPLSLAVAHGKQLAAFIHALHTGDRDLLRYSLLDLLAEPHRAALVPGFREVQRAALKAGAWACSFSGAGPAIFAMVSDSAAAVGEAMARAYRLPAVLRTFALDPSGARLMEGVPCPC